MKTTEQTGILTMKNVSLLRGGLMPSAIDYRQQIAEELRLVPDEKLADLAKIVHVFTEDSPEAQLARACQQASNNDVLPLDSVWETLDD